MTLGSKGAAFYARGNEPARVSAISVTVRDTTGAGDTFVGTFASGLAADLSVVDAMRRAVIAASLACEGEGAQTAMPYAQTLESYLGIYG